MRTLALGPLLRGPAIIIALIAAIDPAITSHRTAKPDIAVTMSTSGSSSDSAFTNRVAGALSKEFTVVRAPIAAAAATVVVGDRLPADPTDLASPVFAVFGDRTGPAVSLSAVHAPPAAPSNSRIPVSMTAHVTGARGRTLSVSLRAASLVIDRATRSIAGDDERVSLSLTFVPTAAGSVPLRVSASLAGSRDSATTDVVVDVEDKRWAVLFFDPRPSWMSTFVRRAIERDPRFIVTSRVVTSRSVSTEAGHPPSRLDDLPLMTSFDAVVVGAPDALVERDVAGLDGYLRRRGGSVVMLFDQRAPGTMAYERLVSAGPWAASTDSALVAIATDVTDSAAMRASEVMWPLRLPATASIIAHTPANPKRSASDVPVVWRTSVGAGRLVVSGALDAWRYRDRSGFDGFWRSLIAESAQSSPAAVAVHLSNATPAPGEQIDVSVNVRDADLQEPNVTRPVRTNVSASLMSADAPIESTTVRLWPGDGVGELRGAVRAPEKPGLYRLTVSADGNTRTMPLVVATDASHPNPDDRDLVAAWAQAHDGRALPASRLSELPSELRRAIHPPPRLETWYPMRSGWWIVPFAILLSTEWWLRRRRGLA
jgi:hypothetical protein